MAKTTDKPPAESEPKQRPVKRPAKPRMAYEIPRGIAFDGGDGVQIRVRAGAKVEHGIIPDALIDEYLERGDIIALDNTTTKGK